MVNTFAFDIVIYFHSYLVWQLKISQLVSQQLSYYLYF